jgi:hypothetical protein
VVVWVDEWQQACCGEEFAVGATVTWQLASTERLTAADTTWLAAVVGDEEAATVTHHEEHHDGADTTTPVTGTVESIRAAYCRYAPLLGEDPRMHHPVPGTAVLDPIDTVSDTVSDLPRQPELSLVGFLVELRVH